jgi:hypothetical protein
MKRYLYLIIFLYLSGTAVFASMNLDVDEFTFIKEPYQIIGGDYTLSYLQEKKYSDALLCLYKSYSFYWHYRPLFSPIISENDKSKFAKEEERFNYVKMENEDTSTGDLAHYQQRFIVPEPDRFYSHGAGKPLLPAVLSIPQLAAVNVLLSGDSGQGLLFYQFNHNYHPIFILTRLVQILAGLASLIMIYLILRRTTDESKAILGAGVFALSPLALKYFPNLHHDAILIPFLIATVFFFLKERFLLAGVAFGLALASKNTAIFLPAILVIYCLVQFLRLRRDTFSARSFAFRHVGGLLSMAVVGMLVLSPFANPVSYMREVASPVFHREYDPRGENVSSFTVSGRLQRLQGPPEEGRSFVRKEVLLFNHIFIYNSLFFLIIFGIFLLSDKTREPIALVSYIALLFIIPYSLLFGTGMNWRYLFFLPFFVFLGAHALRSKQLALLIGMLMILNMVYLMDPITTGTLNRLNSPNLP